MNHQGIEADYLYNYDKLWNKGALDLNYIHY